MMLPPPFLAHFVSLDSLLKEAHPAARRSRFRGCLRTDNAPDAMAGGVRALS